MSRLVLAWALVLGLVLPAMAGHARDPKKCGRTLISRALKVGKGGRISTPKRCPLMRLPDGYYSRGARDGGIMVYHRDDPTTWLVHVLPPDKQGTIRYNDGRTEVWKNGRLTGTVTVHEDGGE
jgi:hypothetical protein